METHLRLVLLAVGVIIIVGIVLDALFRKNFTKKPHKIKEEPVAPKVETGTREEIAELQAQQKASLSPERSKRSRDIIAIYVLARQHHFTGSNLLSAIKSTQLEFGEMNLFHRYDTSNKENTLFSVALAVEPGTFDLENIHSLSAPGVVLFMTVKEPVQSMLNFDHMLSTARQLAMKLEGDLKDGRRQPLTIQAIESCRERIRRSQYQAILAEI